MLKFLCALMLLPQMYGAVFGPRNYIPTCVFEQGGLYTEAAYMSPRISTHMIEGVLDHSKITISDDVKRYVAELQEWSKDKDLYTRGIFLENVLRSLLCHFDGCVGFGDSYVYFSGDVKVFFEHIPKYLSSRRHVPMDIVQWKICCGQFPGFVIGERDNAWPENCAVTIEDFVWALYTKYEDVVEKMLAFEAKLQRGLWRDRHPFQTGIYSPSEMAMNPSLGREKPFEEYVPELFERIMRVHNAFKR